MFTAKPSGFTVVETLIFLAVSALLFASAMTLVVGRQGKLQFTNAVREFEAQLTDVANDVGTGYFEADSSLRCHTNIGGYPAITPPNTNECIFVGRTIALGSSYSQYNTFTMVGLRNNASGNPVSQLMDTKPQVFDASLKKTTSLEGGATIACVKISGTSGCPNTAISFVSRLNGNLLESSSTGGSGIVADLYTSVGFGSPNASAINATLPTINKLSSDQSLTICLRSGSSDQHAIITISGASSVSIKSEIGQGGPPVTSCQ